MGSEDLVSILIRHEGMKLRAYLCPAGKITIGIGRNLEDVGLSEEEAMFLLRNDIERVRREVALAFPWFKGLDEDRQNVLISMAFNMGLARLKGFKKMLLAVEAKQFDQAASEMLSSAWASQVGRRAVELASMMRGNAVP